MRPRDREESGFGARVGDHITLGTGIDGIANAPRTRQTPTHHTQQTPWTKYKNFIPTPFFKPLKET